MNTGCILRIIRAALFGGSCLAQPLQFKASQSPLQEEQPAATKRGFVRALAADQKAIWTAPLHSENYNWRFLLPFGLATAGLIASDKQVGRELSESPPGTGAAVSRGLAYSGSAATAYGFAGVFYGLARLKHNDRARETGRLALEALLNSSIVVELLKVTTQRERPTADNGRRRVNNATGAFWAGGTSFPSGHAITSWSLASVMAGRYPNRPLIKYGAYGLAATASISRMTARRHFPSDILVGSVLGYLIGHYVIHRARLRSASGRQVP